MFKKLVKIGGQNQLSGKDRKILKTELQKLMGAQEIQHFFTKNEKIICEKVSGSKILIYITDDYPAFVDATGKSDFFPTLYTLGAYPNIIPSLTLCEGVETFIFNGANLMWPGVADYSQLGDFVKEEIVAVRSSKGEFVAIAGLAISRKDLNQATNTGIACHVLHYLNDKLWEHGTKVMPPVQLATEVKKLEPKVAPLKAEEVKKEDLKKKEEPNKQEPKKEELKKQEPKKQEPAEEPPKKGKKDKKDKNKKEEEQPKEEPQKQVKKQQLAKPVEQPKKQAPKPQPKQVEPQSSSQEQDLTALIHHKKPAAPVPKKIEVVRKGGFSDDEDDDKKKKKGKKQHQKKQQEVQKEQVKKEKPKGKGKKHQESQSEEEKQEVKKPKAKGKKHQQQEVEEQKPKKGKRKQDDSDQEVKKPKKGDDQSDEDVKRNKGKKGKKEVKKEQSDDQVKQTKQKKKDQKKNGSDDEEDVAEEKNALSPHIMDQQFKQALLNALKLGVDDSDLPMDSGLLFTDYIVRGRKQGVTLDIKQSTFKKMNKFYEAMDRLGILQFKQGKQKSGAVGPTINKIHRDCEILADHIPTIKKLVDKDADLEEEKDIGPSDPKLKFQLSSTVEVIEVYKLAPPKKQHKEPKEKEKKDKKKDNKEKQVLKEKDQQNIVQYLFPKKGKEVEKEIEHKGAHTYDPDEYYTEKQVKERIKKYLAQFEEETGKKKCEVDEEQKGKKKKKQVEIEDQGKKKKGENIEKYLYINYTNDPFLQKLLADEIEEHEDFLKAQQEEQEQEKEDATKEKQKQEAKNKKKKERETRDKNLLKITKQQIQQKVMQHLEPYHQITDKPNNVLQFHAGRFKGIQVTAEKNSNKNVTTLSGIELFVIPKNKVDQQMANLLQLLQQKFNCSVSAHNLPKKGAGKELMIQGNFLDEVVEMLTEDYKIKKEYITTTNKLDKKKKNN